MDKSIFIAHCNEQYQNKLQEIKIAIAVAQDTLHNETKSSMGDKYETSREMVQQDLNRLTQQERQLQEELTRLSQVPMQALGNTVTLGSIVETDQYTYFIAVSLGVQRIGRNDYMCVSPQAPIAKLMIGKKKGDQIEFRGNTTQILRIS
ncbi:MAG TPA: GreA/GreB family elongation factor [Candidatus Sphingobacterium stercorigallinarum]|nr:GreA/GreB family elongation factor [Candidatus Sphingobacterium stercorigallinarum]